MNEEGEVGAKNHQFYQENKFRFEKLAQMINQAHQNFIPQITLRICREIAYEESMLP